MFNLPNKPQKNKFILKSSLSSTLDDSSKKLLESIETYRDKVDDIFSKIEETLEIENTKNLFEELTKVNKNLMKSFSIILRSERKMYEEYYSQALLKKQKEISGSEETKIESETKIQEDEDEENNKKLEEAKKKAGPKRFRDVIADIFDKIFSFFLDIATFKAIAWVADPKNQEELKFALSGLIRVYKVLDFLMSASVGNLLTGFSDLVSVFKDFPKNISELGDKLKKLGSGLFRLYAGFSLGALILLNPKLFIRIQKLAISFGINLVKKIIGIGKFLYNLPTTINNVGKAIGTFISKIPKFIDDVALKIGTFADNLYYFARGLKVRTLRFMSRFGKFIKNTKAWKLISRLIPRVGTFFKPIGKFVGKNLFRIINSIPLLGPIIDVSVRHFIFGESLDRSVIGSLGFSLGSSLGGALSLFLLPTPAAPLVPVIAVGAGFVGDFIALKIYDYFNKNSPKLSEGGIVDKPTLALVGEEGKEYIIPENEIPEKIGFASTIVGATEAFVKSLGPNAVPLSSYFNSLISPLKRVYGTKGFIFPQLAGTSNTPYDVNIFGLTKNEMDVFYRDLKVLQKQVSKSNRKGVEKSYTTLSTSGSTEIVDTSTNTTISSGGGFTSPEAKGIGGKLKEIFGKATSFLGIKTESESESESEYDDMVSGYASGRYYQGDIGSPKNYHFHVGRDNKSFFERNVLDKYVEVFVPGSDKGVPISRGYTVPGESGGKFDANRPRGLKAHKGWDYAFARGAYLKLKNGAVWVKNIPNGKYGDNAYFKLPNGLKFVVVHGKFKQEANPSPPKDLEDNKKTSSDSSKDNSKKVPQSNDLKSSYYENDDLNNKAIALSSPQKNISISYKPEHNPNNLQISKKESLRNNIIMMSLPQVNNNIENILVNKILPEKSKNEEMILASIY